MAYKDFQKGNKVIISYGQGVVTKTRPEDGICVVQLPYGMVYTCPDIFPMRKAMTTEEINAAFEAAEKARKLNLELECSELGIVCDHSKCKYCQLENALKEQQEGKQKKSSFFPSMKFSNPLQSNKIEACLLCANPTCSNTHASKTFQKEKIVLCVECEALFQSEPLETELKAGIQQRLERLMDAYDRAFLLLRYSSQFIPLLVEQLQAEAARDNKVTLGTSSVGFMSGAMGLAGAAALLTPAGPPLLMASFVFGTSNAAVGLGYTAQKHAWQNNSASPTQVANRLMALYGFLQAAMERIVTLREQVHADPNLGSVVSSREMGGGKGRNAYLQALSQGITLTKESNTVLRLTNAAGYSASASVFDMVGAAPVVGQIFSGAMMVLDYQIATSTLEKIKKGSPSEKAKMLQQKCDLNALVKLPTTGDLEAEVQDIMKAVGQGYNNKNDNDRSSK